MASDWPVWCEIVCQECAKTVAGCFVTTRLHKAAMRNEAKSRGWKLIDGDWTCKPCQRRAVAATTTGAATG